jgi:hypothetical protein
MIAACESADSLRGRPRRDDFAEGLGVGLGMAGILLNVA